MPYNPDTGNAERWAFRCSCTWGQWVDPPSVPAVNGSLWGGQEFCTTRNYLGWLHYAVYLVNALSALGVFVFASNTWVRLQRESNKGCCKTKLNFELIMVMAQFALVALCFMLTGPYVSGLQAAGVNHHHVLYMEFILEVLRSPIPTLYLFNSLIVALTWTHVAMNVRAFQNVSRAWTTPGTARKRARTFVGVLVSISLIGLILQINNLVQFVDSSTGPIVYALCAIVVVTVYLVGSCKLQAVIGGHSVVVSSTQTGESSISAAVATTSSRAVGSVMAWATQKPGGAKRQHHHLQTILQAARGIVAACCVFAACSVVFSFQGQGVANEIFVFLMWHALHFGGYVVVRYYRKAMLAGAMRKRQDDLRLGDDTGVGVRNDTGGGGGVGEVGEVGEVGGAGGAGGTGGTSAGETKSSGGSITHASVVPVTYVAQEPPMVFSHGSQASYTIELA